MLTTIQIAGLQTFGYHGLFEEERSLGQKFTFDIDATLNPAPTHRDDRLDASIRYDAVVDAAVSLASGSVTRESLGWEEPRIALRSIRATGARRRTARPRKSFSHHDNLFPETGRKTSRSSAQRRRNQPGQSTGVVVFSHRRIPRRPSQSSGEDSMSKRIALLSAAVFSALAFTATITAPASAEEKTVMVGGAAMFPSKNIVQNAVNSKDHTTLVAAVKAAGLVETLESKGPFTVFAPTNTAFGKLPAGTVDTLVKPENKATLTKILTYHVVPGKLAASDLKDGMKLKTAEGEELTVKQEDGKVWIVDAKGGNLDGHDLERQSVERRDPCGRHRADAGVLSSRAPLTGPNRACGLASRGNPARFFVNSIARHASI